VHICTAWLMIMAFVSQTCFSLCQHDTQTTRFVKDARLFAT